MKNPNKKAISFLTSAILLISCLSFTAFAVESAEVPVLIRSGPVLLTGQPKSNSATDFGRMTVNKSFTYTVNSAAVTNVYHTSDNKTHLVVSVDSVSNGQKVLVRVLDTSAGLSADGWLWAGVNLTWDITANQRFDVYMQAETGSNVVVKGNFRTY
jgi:hypothetical protein